MDITKFELQEFSDLGIDQKTFSELREIKGYDNLFDLRVEPCIDNSLFNFSIKSKNIVGVLSSSEYQVIVKPKIESANIFLMMNYAFGFEINFPNDKSELEKLPDEIQYLFAYYFLESLKEFLKNHFSKNYVKKEEVFNACIKGKVELSKYFKKYIPAGKRNLVPCTYFDMNADTLENQILRYTLEIIRKFIFNDTNINSTIKEILRPKSIAIEPYLSGITLRKIRLEEFNRIRYVGRFKNYKPIHELCKFIISNNQMKLDSSTCPFRSFIFDMNKLFEKYVTGVIKKGAKYYGFESQENFIYSSTAFSKTIKPDITLTDKNNFKIVIDAKYKNVLTNEEEPIISNITNSDLFQLIAYSKHEKINASKSILVYPLYGKATETQLLKIKGFEDSSKYYLVGIHVTDIEKKTILFQKHINNIIYDEK
ncbi:MAG: McrC family protein [Melioribacteraceae bacterium]|nr:McrC family protein [Melioribacteraceae bacterium]